MEILLVLAGLGFIIFILMNANSSPKIKSPDTFSLKGKGFNFFETFEVVGVHLPENKHFIINYVSEKDPVTLEPEPSNPYNSKSIAVYHESFKIGYIADNDLDEVHDIMQQQYLSGIESKTLHGDWLNLYINIYFKEEF